MKNKIKVSDLIIEFLEQKNISTVFTLSGGMMMHLLDSLSKSKKIQYICNHHEQACSFAAEGYARAKNKIGVCFATSGPGSTNTITGIASAFVESTPMMVLTGQSNLSLTARGLNNNNLRMVGTFEIDISSISKPITKYSQFIDDPKSILYHLEKAYNLAISGRPGPILLDIPLDIQSSLVDKEELIYYTPPTTPFFTNNLQEVFDQIQKSKKPLILAGHGVRVANQVQEFRNLIKKLNIPVVSTQLGSDIIPYDNNLYIGKVGLRGDRAGNHAVQTSDLIITLGSSLHVTTTGYKIENFAPKAKIINIDLDKGNLDKNKSITNLQIKIDIKEFITSLSKYPLNLNTQLWIDELLNLKSKFEVIKEPHNVSSNSINTYFLIDLLSQITQETDILIADSGSLYYILGQTFKPKSKQRVIVNGALGSMGYALPASIGAALASPEKNIICLVGDGSLHTNIHELSVIAHHNLNIKIIAVNNEGYASIRNTQESFLQNNIVAADKTTVSFPNWGGICNSYCIPHYKSSKFNTLKDLLNKNLNKKGPKFFEVIVPPKVELLPSVKSTKNKDGSFNSNMLNEMSPKLN